ncbi:hypothetical protein Bhyg_13896 [Pseudolycoriella hygida]|uniref:Uncharacterized protein n=1 Tax=Pseudolycoriella hygida TaxID=35572 RepID=A0A9Q0MP82_9DIPT|nr:hypothetical protein Bhyg_13896 [Pseudolycoriella hygida]
MSYDDNLSYEFRYNVHTYCVNHRNRSIFSPPLSYRNNQLNTNAVPKRIDSINPCDEQQKQNHFTCQRTEKSRAAAAFFVQADKTGCLLRIQGNALERNIWKLTIVRRTKRVDWIGFSGGFSARAARTSTSCSTCPSSITFKCDLVAHDTLPYLMKFFDRNNFFFTDDAGDDENVAIHFVKVFSKRLGTFSTTCEIMFVKIY